MHVLVDGVVKNFVGWGIPIQTQRPLCVPRSQHDDVDHQTQEHADVVPQSPISGTNKKNEMKDGF